MDFCSDSRLEIATATQKGKMTATPTAMCSDSRWGSTTGWPLDLMKAMSKAAQKARRLAM